MSENLQDHDGILELKTKFGDFKESILAEFAKFEERLTDVNEREEGTEKFIGGMKYEEMVKLIVSDHEFIADFKGGWKYSLITLHVFYILVIIIISLLGVTHTNILKMFNLP